MNSSRRYMLALLVCAGLASQARAQDHTSHSGHGDAKSHPAAAPKGSCDGAELACALVATPAFDAQGRLWMIWTAQNKVWVAHQDAPGGPLSKAVAITPNPVRLDGGPDSRPKIAVDASGRIATAFAVLPEGSWNGQIYTSASTDGGKTFTAPARLDPNSPGHRFEALQFMPDGRLLIAAIDKTHAEAAKKAGAKYAGAALSLAWSTNAGTTWSPPAVAADQTCECCRIAMALAPDGLPVIVFRNVFEGTTRDHAMIALGSDGKPGPLRRVSNDAWATNACPHQGPALAISPSGTRHVTWYTAGTNRKGVFYARSTDEGAQFSQPLAIGRPGVQVSRPQVLATATTVYLAWKEFDGEATSILMQSSADDGGTWTPPAVLAATKARADHPQLIASPGGSVFVSWLTDAEGHRLLKVVP